MSIMKPYVGVKSTGDRQIFQSDTEPEISDFKDEFVYVIGPFRTKRAAVFLQKFGKNNPHCQSVADAERISKHIELK